MASIDAEPPTARGLVMQAGASQPENVFKPSQAPGETDMMTEHELTEMVLLVMHQQLEEKMRAAKAVQPSPEVRLGFREAMNLIQAPKLPQ